MNAHEDRADLLVLALLALGVGAGAIVWMTGEMVALLYRGRWLPLSPAAVGPIVARLPSKLGNPARAWPLAAQAQLPTGRWWYAAAASISLALVVAAVWAFAATVRGLDASAGDRSMPAFTPWRCRPARAGRFTRTHRRPRAPRSRGGGSRHTPPGARRAWSSSDARRWQGAVAPQGRHVGGAHWAQRRDLGTLRVRRSGEGRLVLGRVGRSLVATEAAHSVLVLGPTQSGKTTSLAIPALLEWDGPVVATSVKDDLLANTGAYRATLGRLWVFDPTAAVRAARRAGWSPLSEASSWGAAQRVAKALVGATPSQVGLSEGAFWFSAAAKLLAPLLLAAERGDRTMAEVVRWTNLQEIEEVQWLLEAAGEIDAVHALIAGLARDERIRSSIYTTLETVLAPYEDPVVAESAAHSDIDAAALLEGSNTLYLCGPAHEQARVQGVFSALVGAIVHAAIGRYERGGPLDPPLLVVLDEAANIAPIQELDALASTAAGMGIQLVTVCQDLAQLASRYGPDRARSIANNHRAKVALSGISDVGTLDTISGLAGEQAVREQTITAEREGRRSTSSAIAYRRLAPAGELRRVPPGFGVLIYGHLPPARLALRPWYRDRELRCRVALAAPGTESA